MRLYCLIGLAMACSDTGLRHRPDDPEPPEPSTCDEAVFESSAVSSPADCPLGFSLGTPYVKWQADISGVSGVGPLFDSNGDGRVDEADALTIAVGNHDGVRPGNFLIDHHGELVRELPSGSLNVFDASDGLGPRVMGFGDIFVGDVPDREHSLELWTWRHGHELEWVATEPTPWTGRSIASTWRPLPFGFDMPFVLVTNRGAMVSPSLDLLRDEYFYLGEDRMAYPALVDVDGDGEAELLLSDRILNADGSDRCRHRFNVSGHGVVDLDGDGRPELIASRKWGTADGEVVRQIVLMRECSEYRVLIERRGIRQETLRSGFVVADFLGDGSRQVLAVLTDVGYNTEHGKLVLLDAMGVPIWEILSEDRYAMPFAVDLDGDGTYEVLHGGRVLHGPTGDPLLSIVLDGEEIVSAQVEFIADIDNDGHVDIGYNVGSKGFIVASSDLWVSGPSCWSTTFIGEDNGAPYYDGVNLGPGCTLPDPSTPSWKGPNVLNAVPSIHQPGDGTDLSIRIADACDLECGEGLLKFTVQPGNLGTVDAPGPARVDVYGERDGQDHLLVSEYTHAIPAATWLAGLSFAVEVDGSFDDLRAEIHAEGWAGQQCDEDNDVHRLGRSLCRR